MLSVCLLFFKKNRIKWKLDAKVYFTVHIEQQCANLNNVIC